MNILAEDSVRRILELVGPTDPSEAKSTNPECIRAKFGQDITKNVMHASKSSENAEKVFKYSNKCYLQPTTNSSYICSDHLGLQCSIYM